MDIGMWTPDHHISMWTLKNNGCFTITLLYQPPVVWKDFSLNIEAWLWKFVLIQPERYWGWAPMSNEKAWRHSDSYSEGLSQGLGEACYSTWALANHVFKDLALCTGALVPMKEIQRCSTLLGVHITTQHTVHHNKMWTLHWTHSWRMSGESNKG